MVTVRKRSLIEKSNNFTQADEKLAEQLNNSPELARKFGMESGEVNAGAFMPNGFASKQ